MARSAAIILLAMAATTAFPGTVGTHPEPADLHPAPPSGSGDMSASAPLTAEQQNLVAHAIGRFDAQGLELPEIDFVFHDDLQPCHGHKGRYHTNTRKLEMCSMDPVTMLHELAHAWANENLSEQAKERFVLSHGLDSWNNHADAWEDRGTEHVAETIAWALADDPHHVRWVETLPDGSKQTTQRILTLDIDVDTLLDNFKQLTGMDPLFRHADEWADDETATTSLSPELARSEAEPIRQGKGTAD